MEIVWSLGGSLGVLSFLFALAAALWILFARPGRFQNRVVALALAAEALYIGVGFGLARLMGDPADAAGLYAVNAVVGVAACPVFLLLVSTLGSPLARPFASRGARLALAGLAVASVAGFFVAPELYIVGVEADPYSPWRGRSGPLSAAADVAALAIFAYNLAAAVWAFLLAQPGSAARQHARAYAIAFGVRDGAYVATITWGIIEPVSPLQLIAVPLISLAFVALLALGILRTQLFDMDLRIKWTIRQGTVAAAFVAVFFVVSESAAAFFEGRAGTYAGIAAAGLLVFALAPIQRLAERFSDRAMPAVRPTPEYLAYKKLEVYRATLEGALADGEVTSKEREMLARLRASLEIHESDAAAMEAELARRG